MLLPHNGWWSKMVVPRRLFLFADLGEVALVNLVVVPTWP